MALGTEMNLELVRNTPLSSPKGTPVNEFLETDEKGIYAAGDIALYPDRICWAGCAGPTTGRTPASKGCFAGSEHDGQEASTV